MIPRRTLILCLAPLAATWWRPATAQTVDEITKRGELVVAIDLTNPPWGYMDELTRRPLQVPAGNLPVS